jgi:hypothetical protein
MPVARGSAVFAPGRPREARLGQEANMATDREALATDQCSTALILDELQLFGHRPFDDEPDPRPLPEGAIVAGAVCDIFDALVASLEETRLEPDLDDLLWATVNLFHRHCDRIERELDSNEQAQRRSQREQDGSEVRSTELERLLREGLTLVERRDAFELMRDQATHHYRQHMRRPWMPASRSLVTRKTLTASMIDSRDFIAARHRAESEIMLPAGTRIALAGGADYDDHQRIWTVLDRVHAKHIEMVLIHGGNRKGAEHIAALWARERHVPQIAFRPDFERHRNAAPFKRNDQMLDTLPAGVIVFPGTGIQDNLADKARKMGIPLMDFRKH